MRIGDNSKHDSDPVRPAEPHWPADGSGDEFDGGYDETAYATGREIHDRDGTAVRHQPGNCRFCDERRGTGSSSDPTYHPGDYESPHTAPFVQVRLNGELVPGHIVYPWPDGLLVVEPLEA